MAKLEEKDPRWIVEERKDGTNVGGWHWVEKDMMPWSRERLQQLFSGMQLINDPAKAQTLTITGLEDLKGEALVNNRKNKIIPSYELEIRLNWAGSVAGEEAKGKVVLPYVSDENSDEEPEVKVALEAETKAAKALKEAFLQGPSKKAFVDVIHKYVAELRAGGPTDQSSSTTQPSSNKPSGATTGRTKLSSATPEEVKPSTSGTASKAKASQRDLKLTERFYCHTSDLYDCFVIEGKMMAFTQSKATVQPQPGSKFSWFSGAVQGEFEELVPGKRLVLDWRFSSWCDGCMSKVVLDFEEPEPGNCVITLTQTGIPETDRIGNEGVLETTEKGWRANIFQRIRAVFGYGLGM
uniref:Activator of Hsp90 ATPase AHSA1-like N-terminal domain-containing protein n=1 Tax=Dunaliella tertiolecta TaxID=3047 RepID=A0A7S3RA74_DUNTE|mmetsp:Transcript_6779/g.18201  ORF Transcript_6779/g.18201 Transcript_6779/m.18201 type:complete len:352 (+) Transcript_6779:69-1124(+)